MTISMLAYTCYLASDQVFFIDESSAYEIEYLTNQNYTSKYGNKMELTNDDIEFSRKANDFEIRDATGDFNFDLCAEYNKSRLDYSKMEFTVKQQNSDDYCTISAPLICDSDKSSQNKTYNYFTFD